MLLVGSLVVPKVDRNFYHDAYNRYTYQGMTYLSYTEKSPEHFKMDSSVLVNCIVVWLLEWSQLIF